MTRNGTPSSWPTSYTVQMLGWLTRAMARASRWNRSSSSGVAPRDEVSDFDGHRAVESRVPGTIDLTHPSSTEAGQNLVGADSRARGEGHW